MKNRWSVNYIWNKTGSGLKAQQWRRQKQQELEQNTGVPWSTYQAHMQYVFMPYLQMTKVETNDDPELIARFWAGWKEGHSPFGGMSFLKVHELSGLDLLTVMQVANHLTKAGKISAVVDRMGKYTAFVWRAK